MNTVVSHLSRRGVELATEFANDDHKMPEDINVSPAGIALVVLSAVVMVVVLGLVDYTLNVVLTLTALEDTTKSIALVADPTNPNDTAKLMEPELSFLQRTPITAKVRTTIRHLHNEAGWTARWRGMWLAICYHLVHAVLTGLLLRIFGGVTYTHRLSLLSWSHLVNIFANIIASVVLARWAITWTHVVLTSPDKRPWFRRIPRWSALRKVLFPTAFAAFVRQLSIQLPASLSVILASSRPHEKPCASTFQIFGILVLYLVMLVGLVIPAEVSLIRMQASLLPGDAEPIIPFDATYGGKVVPEALGGKGYLSFKDSWRTFDKESRRRFLKMVIKTTFMSFALAVSFGIILASEVSLVAWDTIKEQLEKGGLQYP